MICIEYVEEPGDNEDTYWWRNWSLPTPPHPPKSATNEKKKVAVKWSNFAAAPFWGILSTWVNFCIMDMIWGSMPVTVGMITSELRRILQLRGW